MKAFSGKVKVLFVLILSFISSLGYSQVDKEFWFSIPYVNKNHAVSYLPNSTFGIGGGQPIYLRMSTLGNPAVVTVSIPRNLTVLDSTITIAAYSTATIDLTPFRSFIEVSQTYSQLDLKNGGAPENKGMHISSSEDITAYY